ncbi:MAG: amidohydrolase, partial [Bacilli bacterium]
GPFDRVILCRGNVLMPGFKNAHNHSAMTFLRSYADDLALRDWLYNWVFPIEAKLQPSDVYHLSKLAFAEYLTSGITANFDMYYFPKEIARAAIDFGMRTIILGTPTSFKESISSLRDNYEAINGKSDLVSFRLGFHAEYTSTHEMLVSLSGLANELKAPVFTHISETQNEVDGCIERHGDTPAVYFEKLGLFNYGGGGFHGVYLTEQDMEIFKRRNLHLVTCPSSNTKLASGIAPIQKFLDYGINLSLGTDGPASNNSLDFFREMFLVTGLSKLKTMDPTSLDGYQVLKMATVGGARALGLDDADTLEVGKLADIIMIDLYRPNMQPINNIEKNIVYSGSKENVKMTMINGRILYEDGNFLLGESIEDIYKRAQEITDRIKQEITK